MVDAARSRTRVQYGTGRQAVIEAAVRLVARDGLSRLTTRALIAEAGVSQGSLQHHFPSVYDVLGPALEHCVDLTLSYLTTPTDVTSIFDDLAQALREHPDIAAFQIEVFLEARRRPALLEVVGLHQQLYRQNLRRTLIELGLEPDERLVQVLMAFGDGVGYEFAVFGQSQLDNVALQLGGMRALLAPLSQAKLQKAAT